MAVELPKKDIFYGMIFLGLLTVAVIEMCILVPIDVNALREIAKGSKEHMATAFFTTYSIAMILLGTKRAVNS